MNKQVVVYSVISMAIGATVGSIVTDYILKKKYQKKADEEINRTLKEINEALSKEKKEETEEPKPEPKQTEKFDYTKAARQIIRDEGYAEDEDEEEDADSEHPIDDDEEALRQSEEMNAVRKEYEKKHAGKIEAITLDEWDSDFPETDYDKEELWYFTDGDTLTDETGVLCSERAFCGTILDRYGFKTNDDEDQVVFIRNHILRKEFMVHKVTDCDREVYFENSDLTDEVREE